MINSGYTHENSIYQVNRISQSIPVNFEMENYADRGSTKKSRIIQAVVDLCIIIIVFIIFILVLFLVEPKTRHFSCDESDLFYPLLKDTVPFWAVGIFGIAGPIVIILGVEFLNGNFLWFQKDKSKRCRCFMISLYHSLSLFLMGVAIVLCLTEIGKRWIGRLRPHFMAVCKPDFSSFTCLSPAGSGFVPIQINTGGNFCTGDRKEVEEARLSFPSGHASFSWYTMLFTIIYLEARWVLVRFRYVKTILQLTCFIAAFVTMLSRVSDYHHRGSDVIGGTVLGVLVALAITIIVGRVLWVFDRKQRYEDFDLKE